MEICQNTFKNAAHLQELQINHEELLRRLLELSTLEASSNDPENPSNQVSREPLLREITVASNKLRKVLSCTWEQVEEALWRDVLSSFIETQSSTAVNFFTISKNWDSVHYRHHTALCQALTATLTALALAVTHWTPTEWKQMVRCGVPLHFEGLLSCYGEEIGMLENWAWAIQSLAFCRIVLRPNSSLSTSSVKMGEAALTEEEELEGDNRSMTTPVRILRHNEILVHFFSHL